MVYKEILKWPYVQVLVLYLDKHLWVNFTLHKQTNAGAIGMLLLSQATQRQVVVRSGFFFLFFFLTRSCRRAVWGDNICMHEASIQPIYIFLRFVPACISLYNLIEIYTVLSISNLVLISKFDNFVSVSIWHWKIWQISDMANGPELWYWCILTISISSHSFNTFI